VSQGRLLPAAGVELTCRSEAYMSRGTKGASNWGLGGVILLVLPATFAIMA